MYACSLATSIAAQLMTLSPTHDCLITFNQQINKSPDPKGSLSTETPSETIAHVNWEIQDARNYKQYSGKEQAKICTYFCHHGGFMFKKLDWHLSESMAMYVIKIEVEKWVDKQIHKESLR